MTRPIDDSHDPALRSWVESANHPDSEFPVQNLPFGVFRRRGAAEPHRIGVAIGDQVFDLRQCCELGLLQDVPADVQAALAASALNGLMALGASAMRVVRQHLVRLLSADSSRAEPRALVPMADVEMVVPATVGDYSDFYASIYHATRVGRLFRPDNPLLPNYKYVPIGYHGRASSIVPSGTPVRRPWGQTKGQTEGQTEGQTKGQTKGPDQAEPAFRPTRMLDYELEVGVFVGPGNTLGTPVQIDEAEDHLFGLCLLNDWSARDIQAWEYQPLGPFLAKSFATTVSPWVVTLEALAPFRCPAFARGAEDPAPLPYLSSAANVSLGGLDLRLDVEIQSARMREQHIAPACIGRSSLRELYWTIAQLLTHHTSNGCNLRPGDIMGTGTVSGPDEANRGCLLELTSNGRQPLTLPGGEERGYLADGDEVTLRGYCERDGFRRIGFGACRGIIIAALDSQRLPNPA
jgi:fumarylacetoacetase